MTNCSMINNQQSTTSRLELDNGVYRSEVFTYEGQDCNSAENQIFSLIETGTYTINDTVDVPSGVLAHSMLLTVESRIRNGEPDNISDDQGYLDILHRDGNTLIRAKGNPIGVAGFQVSEELDFSTVYFLQDTILQDPQFTLAGTVDYTGNWMTNCLPVTDSSTETVRLALNNGAYRMEAFGYDGFDCNSLENQDFSRIETGTYSVNDTVEVPSGIIANVVVLRADFRAFNGEEVNVDGEQDYFDIMHRDGNSLFRAKNNPVGTSGFQASEELDFSTVYFLQE